MAKKSKYVTTRDGAQIYAYDSKRNIIYTVVPGVAKHVEKGSVSFKHLTLITEANKETYEGYVNGKGKPKSKDGSHVPDAVVKKAVKAESDKNKKVIDQKDKELSAKDEEIANLKAQLAAKGESAKTLEKKKPGPKPKAASNASEGGDGKVELS